MPQTTNVTFTEVVKNDNKKIKSYNRRIKIIMTAQANGVIISLILTHVLPYMTGIMKRKDYTWQLRYEGRRNAYLETYYQTARYTIPA